MKEVAVLVTVLLLLLAVAPYTGAEYVKAMDLEQKDAPSKSLEYDRGHYGVVEIPYWLNITKDGGVKMKFSTNGGGAKYIAEWWLDDNLRGSTNDTFAIGDTYASAPFVSKGSHNLVIKWNISGTPAGDYFLRAFVRWVYEAQGGGVGTEEADMETTVLSVTVRNSAPNVPQCFSPENNAEDVAIDANLIWACEDYNGDALTYDVYFGTQASPERKTTTRISGTEYEPGTLLYDTTYYWKINATDGELCSESPVQSFTTLEKYIAPNVPPTCSMSANPTSGKEPLSVEFTISVNDPEGKFGQWVLSFGDGSSETGAENRTNHKITHNYASHGTFKANLTVTDDKGAPAYANEITITVNANPLPSCSLSANRTSGRPPLAVKFYFNASDPDSIPRWTLNFGDGTQESGTGNATSASREHTYVNQGTYKANLTVTDANGAKAYAEKTISVFVNPPPSCTLLANRTSGKAPLGVKFTISVSDPDGSIASWVLSFGDGASATGTAAKSGYVVNHTYASAGTYVVNLTATDNEGAKGHAAQITIAVAQNLPPVKPFNPNIGDGTEDVATNPLLTWECSDPNGDALTYDVYFGIQSSPALAIAGIAAKSYAPGNLQNATTYYWKVVARDVDGNVNESAVWRFTTGIAPNNLPAAPTIEGQDKAYVGEECTFRLSSTDMDGGTVKFAIDWNGDGGWDTLTGEIESGMEIAITHEWGEAQTYAIRVSAIDARSGMSAVSLHSIRISERFLSIVDSDGDGLSDRAENFLDTNATDPSDVIEVLEIGGFILPDKGVFYILGENKTTTILYKDVNGDGTIDYVIDSDGDGVYDHYYDGASGAIKPYEPAKPFDWWYLIVIACFISVVAIAIYGVRRMRR